MNENLGNLIWGIIKAILLFLFRLLMLIPVILIAIVGAVVSGSVATLGVGLVQCITQPFTALFEAINNISYEIKTYMANKE